MSAVYAWSLPEATSTTVHITACEWPAVVGRVEACFNFSPAASTGLHMLHNIINLREIFECAHLKFTVSGWSKQASIDTHTCAQCSDASVGLAQARPS